MVCLPDGRYISSIFVYNLSSLHTLNIDRSNKTKWLYANKKKARSRLYSAETLTNTDYADDLVLLANTLARAESQLHSLEQGAENIGLHASANKTEYICFKQELVY